MTTKDQRRAAHEQAHRDAEARRAERREAYAQDHEEQARQKQARREEALRGLREEKPAERQRRLAWSLSAWARFRSGWYYFPFGLVMLWLATARLIGLLDATGVYGPIALWVVLPAAVGFVGLLVFSVFAERTALAREREWMAALPFEVVDYEECLGDEASDTADELRLVLTFSGDAPSAEELKSAWVTDQDGTWSALESDGSVTRSPGPCGSSDSHNGALARWFHGVAEDCLKPLHSKFPLRRVRLLNRQWERTSRS